MSNSPLVSVIMPAYNSEAYIEEAIQSVLSQTYKNFEFIIINDASKDGTLNVIKNYAKKDKRITVVTNLTNLGVGATRALGIEKSKGSFIMWQDSDDISLPRRMELQLDYLLENELVGVVGGYIEFFGEGIKTTLRKYSQNDAELRRRIFMYSPVAQPASMYRKEVYEKVGTYDAQYTVAEDLEMIFRTGTEYRFANVQTLVLRYRQSSTSLTMQALRKMEILTIKIRKSFASNKAYSYTLVDAAFNLAQRGSIYMPSGLRLTLFKLMRGDK